MKTKWIFFSLALAACSGISTQVRVAPGTNLAAYRTFAWAPRSAGFTDTLADQTIRSSLQQDLAQRGIMPAAPGELPDFLISYHTSAQQRTQVSPGMGYPYYWGGSFPYVTTYTEGTLIVDFADARTRQVFWRGTASAVLSHPQNPDPNKIATAVSKMIDQYPTLVAATPRQPL
jgi:hypothetical protein